MGMDYPAWEDRQGEEGRAHQHRPHGQYDTPLVGQCRSPPHMDPDKHTQDTLMHPGDTHGDKPGHSSWQDKLVASEMQKLYS